VGSVASYAERFYEIVGCDARASLGIQTPAAGASSSSRPN
jgi:hypothetical protein